MSYPFPLPIRIFCDLAALTGSAVDLNRGSAAASFIRGTDVTIGIGIGLNNVLLLPAQLASIASVTCQIFAGQNDTNAPMMSSTVLAAAMNVNLTTQQWTNKTSPYVHAAFVFPNSQTAIALNGLISANYWLKIFATTNDATPKIIPLVESNITVKDGPVNALTVPPAAGFRAFTVNGQPVLQFLDPTTGLYHTLNLVNNGDGTFAFSPSNQGY